MWHSSTVVLRHRCLEPLVCALFLADILQHFLDLLLVRDPAQRALGGTLSDANQAHSMMLSHPLFWDRSRCSAFLCLLGNIPDYNAAVTREQFLPPLNIAMSKALKVRDASGERSWDEVLGNALVNQFRGQQEDQQLPHLKFLRVARNFIQHAHGGADVDINMLLDAAPRVIPCLWQFFTLLHPNFVARFHPALAHFLGWRHSPSLAQLQPVGRLVAEDALLQCELLFQ